MNIESCIGQRPPVQLTSSMLDVSLKSQRMVNVWLLYAASFNVEFCVFFTLM